VKHADPVTQLSNPSLEFFPGSKEKISTRMLEQGTQNAVPSSRPHPPVSNEGSKLQLNGTCVIQNCLSLWVHPKGSTSSGVR